jgi:A/G-specific adenine glycosylase
MSREKDLRLSHILIRWYDINKRDLPWRDTINPYVIWISEIILQQTRVDQGYAYFIRFIEKYPTVDLLAAADESEVLKLWQGLGYYSRARNLHAAAKTIANTYGGVFPHSYKDILSLKGVGEYTAAAIISFAYNEAYAVVDGNVFRVLSRIFAIDTPINTGKGKKIFSQLAQSLLDEKNAGLHNQAIMEFGALQCVPQSPNCHLCPANIICLAYAKNEVTKYPVKEKVKKIRIRYFYYFDIRSAEYMFLHKRTKKDIWQNLYELPLIEASEKLPLEEILKYESFDTLFRDAKGMHISYMQEVKHVLSHQTIYAIFYKVEVENIEMTGNYLKIKTEDFDTYPVSRLVHKYMENL